VKAGINISSSRACREISVSSIMANSRDVSASLDVTNVSVE